MPDHPNVVFIFSDQQRYDTLSCYGNDWIKVPQLNALADRSFVFERAYVAQPVCTPARSTIVTGLYPHSAGPIVNKMTLPPDRQSVAEMAPDDYHTGWYGKWHLGDDVIRQHGFDEWISTEDGHRPEYTRREYRTQMSDYHQHLVENGFEPDTRMADGTMMFSAMLRARLPAEHQMASFLGSKAADFIDRNSDGPFMLYVSTFEPHPPYHGPYDDMYDPKELPVGPTFLKVPEGGSLHNTVRAEYCTQYLGQSDAELDPYLLSNAARGHDVTSEAGWRELRARYFANITLVDEMVGTILAALELNGVADNTVVIFTSEHGEMAGDHGMLEKRSMYEESARVPLIMHVPGLSASHQMVPGAVGHVDLVPTILDLMGASLPDHLQGKSLTPVLQGEQTLDGNEVFVQWNGVSDIDDRHLGSEEINLRNTQPWRTIVHDGWKLALCASDQCELYDLVNDPFEQTNLFDHPDHRHRVRDLAARIRLWQHKNNDSAPLPTV
jgi:arylsulfatase A-like enzyme